MLNDNNDDLTLNVNITHHNYFPHSLSKSSYANILYLNARSLRNSLHDIQTFIETQKFTIHIVAIVETWLNIDDVPYFNIFNYHAFHSVRKNKGGGGCAIFVHNRFDTASLVYEMDLNNNNTLIISLLKHKIKILVFYRQPNNPTDLNGLRFIDSFEQLLSLHSNAVVLGDFNFNLLSPTESIYKYENAYSLNGFNLLNKVEENFATRINADNNSGTVIDHVLTDLHFHMKSISFSFFLFHRFADHKSVLLSIDCNNFQHDKLIMPNVRKVTNHKRIIDSKLLDSVDAIDFPTFLEGIKKTIDSNSKMISITSPNQKPYVTNEILNYMIIRNNYFKVKSRYPHFNYAICKYKHYRNLVSNMIKENKKKYLDNFFQSNAHDSHKVWTQMKSLLYNSSTDKKPSCELIYDNGIPVVDKVVIANKFNEFFTNKIRNLVMSQHVDDDDFSTFHAYEQYDIKTDFVNPPCSEDEVSLIIDNLSMSKAIDVYGISNFFVKMHKTSLVPKLAKLINNNLNHGTFPDCLKTGLVNPIHKKGSKTEMSNYRPITILPIFSKIFEYVIKRRLEDHFHANNIMSNNQFGYTRSSNTEIAVCHILNDVYDSVDRRNATSLTCLDLSAAFDCVNHSLLLNKLKKTNLPHSFLNVLSSYFHNRTQFVKIDECLSKIIKVIFGVAQGGVLSGLLFNFYINSLNSIELNSSLFLYCDDITLVTSAINPTTLKQQIETDLQRISVWLRFHYLFPNANKTKYLLFHNKRRQENFYEISLNIKFNGKVIERVEHTKLLGLEIDETLSFSFHMYQLQKKIVSFIFALKRIRSFISEQTAITLYFAYIQSRLCYMNVLWAAVPKYLMDSIEIIQRKALRIVFCKNSLCSRLELYSEKILPVSAMCKFSSAILTFKFINNAAKINFPLTYINQTHRHATRNSDNLVVRRVNTQLGGQNFFIRAFSEFNEIPVEIKKFVSLNLFKAHLREHLFLKNLWCDM
jgi:hypothetical protein